MLGTVCGVLVRPAFFRIPAVWSWAQSLKSLGHSVFINSTGMIYRTSVMEFLGEFMEVKSGKVHMAWNTVNAR